MKFRKGNKVEVLRRTHEQNEAWFPGRIISADGDQYIVKYEMLLNVEGVPVVEKVPLDDVRPQSPPTKEEENWMSGDIAEVFDIHCWRVGKVAKVLKSDRVVVKFLGSIQLKEFHPCSLRIHQVWQNSKWTVIGKVAAGDKNIGNKIVHNNSKYHIDLGSDIPPGIQEVIYSREKKGQEELSTFHHLRTLKRKHSLRFDDATMESGTKKRKQVGRVSSEEANVGKSCRVGYSERDAERKKTSHFSMRRSPMPALITEESYGCSVASCSSNDFPEYTVQIARKSYKDFTDSSFDDAESFCPSVSWRDNISSEDELEANVRELELRAYRMTLQALYASGPLSWAQESVLTNLRLSLRISNEEHLLQLRQLLASQDF
ncbi:hypothetical protein IFM89_002324 [Coptis chinensis]|uniref:ENT domain-containing protein n=1 Tax=Coptis chinensis TaxID=261450 RepID=A0A835IK29_9MAGN|nr:hypothetical protein IFM89_002324 [Coptis chinensis]